MSKLIRSEGIVLRTRAFRESSKIAIVFTRTSGRIDLLARGARRPGSRFGAALEMGTEASFIYYERENSTLWTLSSADILLSHQTLRETPATLSALARILKLLYHISQPGALNSGLYNFTLTLFNAMGERESLSALYDLFLWRASALSGYPAHIDEGCLVCGKPDAVNFCIAQGGFLCAAHSQAEEVIRFNPEERKILANLTKVPVSEFDGQVPPILSRLIRDYARYHLHAGANIIK